MKHDHVGKYCSEVFNWLGGWNISYFSFLFANLQSRWPSRKDAFMLELMPYSIITDADSRATRNTPAIHHDNKLA